MKIFLDSADTREVRKAMKTGMIDGVTTNPTLIKATGELPTNVYAELIEMDVNDISMEVSGDYDTMRKKALELVRLFGPAVTIKLPMNEEGLKLCTELSLEGIRTNVTLVFNAAQALLVAKAGATYVSPFVGRIDDQGYAGLEVVRSISALYNQMGASTKVLAASIRTPHRAVRSFFNGAHVVTMPPKVFWGMWNHVLTDTGLAQFDKDAEGLTLL